MAPHWSPAASCTTGTALPGAGEPRTSALLSPLLTLFCAFYPYVRFFSPLLSRVHHFVLVYEEFQQLLRRQPHESLPQPSPPPRAHDAFNSTVPASVPLGPSPPRGTRRIPYALHAAFPTSPTRGDLPPRSCLASGEPIQGLLQTLGAGPPNSPQGMCYWPLQRGLIGLKESLPTARAALTPLQ